VRLIGSSVFTGDADDDDTVIDHAFMVAQLAGEVIDYGA